jgi:hypothetical protein
MRSRIARILAASALVLSTLLVSAPSASAVPICGGGRYVSVYAEQDYAGKSATFCGTHANIPNLATYGMDGNISSFIVGGASSSRVCFFTGYSYTGNIIASTGADNPNLWGYNGGGYNDTISSIRFQAAANCQY